jgi:hypothetical protein
MRIWTMCLKDYGLFIRVCIFICCKSLTSYLQSLNLRHQYRATHGARVQRKQPASPLERDAEGQQTQPKQSKRDA